MKKFNVGDKVRIIKEPFFLTGHDNGIWKMHGKPNPDAWGIDWGRADMTHLVGLECEIKAVLPTMPVKDWKERMEEGDCFYVLRFPKDTKYPAGLSDFTFEMLEKI